MMTPVKTILIVIAILAAGGVGIVIGRHGSVARPDDEAATTEPAEKKAVATVQTVPIRLGELSKTVIAYGSVTAEPGEVAVLSVPFESRIGRMSATGGQPVAAGDQLLTVDPSPDTQTQLLDAKNAVGAAERDLSQVKQRFESHLATNTDLSQAEQTLQNAQVKLASFEKRGAGATLPIRAEAAGVISKVDVQEGQIVPAGGPLVEIAVENRIAVKLGVQPEDLPNIRLGQPVALHSVGGASEDVIGGTVRLVTQRVNPDTRLVDVFVSLPKNAGLILEQFVRAELETPTKNGLLVPRSAVLPDEDSHSMFTVKDGKAVEHKVSVDLQTDKLVQISGDGIAQGDQVVTVGNYELEDGMGVNVDNSAAASEPTTAATESNAATTEATTEPTGEKSGAQK